MIALNNPDICFVCRRNASGFGVHRNNDDRSVDVGWLCLTCLDRKCGPKAMQMPEVTFDRYEHDVLVFAGNAGGEYLDALGITDLAELPHEQYHAFLEVIINAFGEGMRHACGEPVTA